MKYLLDTCVLLWLLDQEENIPLPVKSLLENRKNKLYISSMSIWEIYQKHSKGKLVLPLDEQPNLINECLDKMDIYILDFSIKDTQYLLTLPVIHQDPFDRMLVCQAINNSMAIITPDKLISKYPVKVIW